MWASLYLSLQSYLASYSSDNSLLNHGPLVLCDKLHKQSFQGNYTVGFFISDMDLKERGSRQSFGQEKARPVACKYKEEKPERG